jgi:hypothetical protein
MSDPEPQDGDVVQVDTEQVDGVIELDDLVNRIRDGAAARAAEARAGTAAATDAEALDRISRLAAQLSDELARLGPLDE